MTNKLNIKYRCRLIIEEIRKNGFVSILGIFLLSNLAAAQNSWYLNATFNYAGSHNKNGAFNKLYYLAGGLKYTSSDYNLQVILPIVAQNGGMYTQIGRLILRDSGLNDPDLSENGEHIKGSIVDGQTITDLYAGIGDLLLIGRYKLTNEQRSLPAIYAELLFKIPTASEATSIGTGKADLGYSIDFKKKFGEIMGSAGISYWMLGNPEGYSLNNPFAFTFGLGKEFNKGKYSVFIIYEGYTKIMDDYSAPKELSILLQYFLSSNTVLSIKASTGLSVSSPNFIFESKLDLNI